MKTSIITGSLLVAFFSGVPVQAQSVIGQWTIIEGVMAGQTVPAETLAAMALKLDRVTFEAKSGAANSTGKLTNNPRITPAQLVFQIENGSDAGREIKAIYQYVGGNMQIAFSQSDEFPMHFESTEDNKYLLLTYKSSAPPVPEKKPKGISAAGGVGQGG